MATAEFSKYAGILSAASSFRICNSSTGIPSHPLVLCVVMLPKAHLTSRDSYGLLFTCLLVFGFVGPSFLCIDFL